MSATARHRLTAVDRDVALRRADALRSRLNRLIHIQYPDVHYQTDFTYNPDGTRNTMTDTRGVCDVAAGCAVGQTESDTTTYSYDAARNLQSVQTAFKGNTRTVSYLYDAANNRTSLTYPDGKIATYAYDADERMQRVTPNWIAGGYTQYAYDGAGRLYQTTLPGGTGVVSMYGYDTANRLTGIINTQGLTTISSHTYVPNPNGNRTSATEYDGVATSTTGFTYDTLDRLSAATYQNPASNVTYQYDGVGNRTTQTVDGTPSTYTYDGADGLATINGVSAAADANGNLRLIDANNTFMFDEQNRLFRTGPCRADFNHDGVVDGLDGNALTARLGSVEGSSQYDVLFDANGDGVIDVQDLNVLAAETTKSCTNTGANTGEGTYYYNGDGLRVRARTFPGGTATDHDYVWDAGVGLPQILQDTNVQSSAVTTFVYGLGLISTTDGSSNTSFYLPDGLGGTSQLTNSAGAITDRYAHDAFGATRSQSGATANDWRFTGQQQDYNANRGLYDLRARSYDPALGRFLQRDPLPFVQRYAYAGDNPANLGDPSGLCIEPGSAAAISAASAAGTAGVGTAICAGVFVGAAACVYYGCGSAIADAAGDVWGGISGVFHHKKSRGPEKKFFDPKYSAPKPGSLWPSSPMGLEDVRMPHGWCKQHQNMCIALALAVGGGGTYTLLDHWGYFDSSNDCGEEQIGATPTGPRPTP